jgi:hypothetical protein
MPKVSNVSVYGFEESIRGAKFPMSVDVDKLNTDLTNGIKGLAQSEHGAGHDQWLTGVTVQFDLTFSLKAWPEAQRYHFLDFVSSQSTMHRIAKMDIVNCCNEYVTKEAIDNLEKLKNEYLADQTAENYLKLLYNIPTGFELTARMTTNYRQLKTIYSQRRNHRLKDWQMFCDWIETLPHSELITGE